MKFFAFPAAGAAALCAVLAGCTTTIASFGTLSVEPVDRSATYTLVERNAQGEDLVYLVWCIPIGFPTIEKAVRSLLNSYDGDLVDKVTVQNYFFWTYFFGKFGYKVTGDVYRKTKGPDSTLDTVNVRLFRSGKKDTLIEMPHD